MDMTTLKSMMNGAKRTARAEATPVTDRQWTTYVTLCRAKYQTQKPREMFNQQSMSDAITQLMTLPNAFPASSAQKVKFKELCELVGIKVADTTGWSNIQISAKIVDLQKIAKATENQVRRLVNYYRFGLVNEIPADISQFNASNIITEHEQNFMLVSDGRLTLGQAMKIAQLELKLHSVQIDIRDLSKLSFEDASEKITLLMQEDETDRQSRRISSYDVSSSTGLNLIEDESRSMDVESLSRLNGNDLEFEQLLDVYHALKVLVGQDAQEDDDTLDNDNINAKLEDLMKLVCIVGEEKSAYGIIAGAVDGRNATKNETVNEIKRRGKRSRTA